MTKTTKTLLWIGAGSVIAYVLWQRYGSALMTTTPPAPAPGPTCGARPAQLIALPRGHFRHQGSFHCWRCCVPVGAR